MTDLPTPERRAELRRAVDQCEVAGEWLKVEHEVIGHLLDATEPVGDADTRLLIDKLTALIPWAEDHSSDVASAIALAASLIERLARELAEARATTWRPIESAPRNVKERTDYVLISDSVCIPDIAIWQGERPARTINGNYHYPVPQGWFSVNQGRSRLDGKATKWMLLPKEPTP